MNEDEKREDLVKHLETLACGSSDPQPETDAALEIFDELKNEVKHWRRKWSEAEARAAGLKEERDEFCETVKQRTKEYEEEIIRIMRERCACEFKDHELVELCKYHGDRERTLREERDLVIEGSAEFEEECNTLRYRVKALDDDASKLTREIGTMQEHKIKLREERDAVYDLATKMREERDALKQECAAQVYKGNSVGYWWAKAKAYGDMVHGCAIPLQRSGHPVDGTGEDSGVGGVRRAVESLVAERDGAHHRRERWHKEARILRDRLEEACELYQYEYETNNLATDLADAAQAAIQTLDEKGRKNPEGNSLKLWEKEWDSMRDNLLTNLDAFRARKKGPPLTIPQDLDTLRELFKRMRGASVCPEGADLLEHVSSLREQRDAHRHELKQRYKEIESLSDECARLRAMLVEQTALADKAKAVVDTALEDGRKMVSRFVLVENQLKEAFVEGVLKCGTDEDLALIWWKDSVALAAFEQGKQDPRMGPVHPVSDVRVDGKPLREIPGHEMDAAGYTTMKAEEVVPADEPHRIEFEDKPGTAESEPLPCGSVPCVTVPIKFPSGTARMTKGETVQCAVCGIMFHTELVITMDDVGGPVCCRCQEKKNEGDAPGIIESDVKFLKGHTTESTPLGVTCPECRCGFIRWSELPVGDTQVRCAYCNHVFDVQKPRDAEAAEAEYDRLNQDAIDDAFEEQE